MPAVHHWTVLRIDWDDVPVASLPSWLLLRVRRESVCRSSQYFDTRRDEKVWTVSSWILLRYWNHRASSLPCRHILQRRQRAAVALRCGVVQHTTGSIAMLGVPGGLLLQSVGGGELFARDVLRRREHIGLCGGC